ncbi:MAG: hypothetical protein ABIK13_04010 [Patescibacteria group bacterium]
MELGHCETEFPPPPTCVVDLQPFSVPAPYFVRIVSDAGERAPDLLANRYAMEAFLALYCVDAVPFREPERQIPIALDEHVISGCLETASDLHYGRGGMISRPNGGSDISTSFRFDTRPVWPRIETAFRDILSLGPRRKLRLRDLDDLLFVRHPGDEAWAFALAISYMVLATRGQKT